MKSPDFILAVPILHSQDVSPLKGIDDSLVNELPANPETFAISDSELEVERDRNALIVEHTEDDIYNYISYIVQSMAGDATSHERLPLSPTASSEEATFWVPPKLMR